MNQVITLPVEFELSVKPGAVMDALYKMLGARFVESPEEALEPSITSVTPKIGEYWPGQGGIYVGMARGWNGDADYPLILGIDTPAISVKWQTANDHAKTIEADGHRDFRVPSKAESALLYANLKDLFDTDHWYWIGEQYSELLAWGQDFSYGYQYDLSKVYELRVRFVRRASVL